FPLCPSCPELALSVAECVVKDFAVAFAFPVACSLLPVAYGVSCLRETEIIAVRHRHSSRCVGCFRANRWSNQGHGQAKNNVFGCPVLGYRAWHGSNRGFRKKSDRKLHGLADQRQAI